MASSFEVTPSELQQLASEISSLVGEIEAAASRVGGGAPGAAQNGRLESSIAAFLGDWTAGLRDMRGKLDAVASKLNGAAGAYERTDQGLAHDLGG